MQQDYTVTIGPGQSEWVSIGEVEFIFIKAADRPIEVVINNYTMVMEVNQKTRPLGRFDGFTMRNPDPVNEATITFVAGLGDYTTQSIKGQLNVVPSVIKSDGTIEADTRFFIDLSIKPDQQFETLNVMAGEIKSRQLIFNGNNTQDIVAGGPFQDGFLASRNEVSSGASGHGCDLAFFDLDGNEREIRRLAFRSANRFGTPKEISPIDDEEFFLTLNDGSKLHIIVASWSGGSVTQKGDSVYTVNTTNPEASVNGGGIEYDPAAKRLTYAYNDPNDNGQIVIETLAYDEVTRTLTNVGTQTIPGPETTNGVQSVATIDGELLVMVKRTSSSAHRLIRVSDQQEVWLSTLNTINNSQSVVRLWQAGGAVYSLESYNSSPSQYIAERYPRDANFNFKGRVLESAQACFGGLFKPAPGRLTEASVESVRVNGNEFRITGELIKAALELFFEGELVPTYLDAIFGVEVQDTGSIPSVYRFYSGNQSFQRLGVADDFSLKAPGTLRLYVDKSFWSVKA